MAFLSFGPELKNGDPLSQDNFLATSWLTLQLSMMRRGVIVGWWVVVGGSPCLFTPGWCGLWTVVSPYNLITSSVYVQTSFGAKSPRPSFYQIF